ncbi:VOC family protein [Actinotalea sp. AC32]|nr:VOC family protein [Actinotalea sp. AC32]
MSGRVVHFEIPYDDRERASAFYREVFGWKVDHMAEFDYTGVTTGPMSEDGSTTAEPGYINGGMAKRGDVPGGGSVVTIDVEDIDATLSRIDGLGGSTVMGRTDVGGMGFTAYFRDCEGNVVGLWQNA